MEGRGLLVDGRTPTVTAKVGRRMIVARQQLAEEAVRSAGTKRQTSSNLKEMAVIYIFVPLSRFRTRSSEGPVVRSDGKDGQRSPERGCVRPRQDPTKMPLLSVRRPLPGFASWNPQWVGTVRASPGPRRKAGTISALPLPAAAFPFRSREAQRYCRTRRYSERSLKTNPTRLQVYSAYGRSVHLARTQGFQITST
jgi:hypothetical protein